MTGSVTDDGLLIGVIPTPPKTTGDTNRDLALLQNWIFNLYQIVQLQQTFVTNSSQTDDNFDPNSLPVPANSNIATAQGTANSAYTLANTANTAATAAQATGTAASAAATAAQGTANSALALATTANDRTKNWLHDEVTVTGAATTGVYNFSPAQVDTNYRVMATPQTSTGAPPDGAFIVADIAKTTNDITLTVRAAPGGVDTVTFNLLIVRF